MAGLRVVRGPDWKWKNQDGGDGHVGTVEGGHSGFLSVIWDDGDKNLYRAGAEDAADLIVLDNGPAGVKHPGVQCDVCSESDMRGIRWKCLECDGYDLCTECYGNDKHNKNHKFKRIDKPGMDGVTVGKRSSLEKKHAIGIYVGAIVVRGPDWDKDDQDGGAGSTGVVVKVGYAAEINRAIAMCVVKWTNKPTSYIYRLGFGGNVDVKYKTSAVGWGYYKEHLPVLRDVSKVCDKKEGGLSGALRRALSGGLSAGLLGTLMDSSDDDDETGLAGALGGLTLSARLLSALVDDSDKDETRKKETMKKFQVGDLVRLTDDLDEFKQLQHGHGGYRPRMSSALGKVKDVRGIDKDGDLKIDFGGAELAINPKAVTKQTTGSQGVKFKIGDKIILNKSVSATKDLQAGHGGWNMFMEKLIDKKTVGTVKEIDSDDDIRVDFGSGVVFLLNPDICSKASKDVNVDIKIPSSLVQHESP